MSAVTTALAKAYSAAPSHWVRASGVTSHVRDEVRRGGNEGLAALRQDPNPPQDAERALQAMVDLPNGADPRGGRESDQIAALTDKVATLLAQYTLFDPKEK